eukprot:m51a1_g10342 hypothetical protein (392) ;mRNA; r:141897-144194
MSDEMPVQVGVVPGDRRTSTDCATYQFTTMPCWPYGHDKCDAPPRLFDEMLGAIRAMYPDPDLILLTGDLPPHSVVTTINPVIVKTWELLCSSIRKHFPEAPVYPSLGNHETFPVNILLPKIRQAIVSELVSVWNKYNLSGVGDRTAGEWGYYSVLHRGGHRVVSTNSLWISPENYEVWSSDPTGMKRWLAGELGRAAANGERTWLLGHIPTSGAEKSNWTDFLNDLLARHPQVTRSFYGHLHTDHLQFVRAHLGAPSTSVSFVAPSTSGKGGIWPSIRVATFDPRTLEEQEIRTFHADVAASNRLGTLQMKLFYEMREEYGMEDLSLASWDRLLARILQDEATAATYNRLLTTKGDERPLPCDAECRKQVFCSLAYATQELRTQCLADPK